MPDSSTGKRIVRLLEPLHFFRQPGAEEPVRPEFLLHIQFAAVGPFDPRARPCLDRDGDGVLEFAQKFVSDPSKKNGLYWETREGEPKSPLGPVIAEAALEGYLTPKSDGEGTRPFHGYYFKILKAQGPNAVGGARSYLVKGKLTEGYAVMAWPAAYGNSGIMTFLVSHQGIVYERDLGPRTKQLVGSMTEFDPDPQWTIE